MTREALDYGNALYDLAAEEGLEAELLEQLAAVADIFRENREYLRLLSSPALPKAERCDLLDQAFRGSVQPYLLNFLKLLCRNGLIRQTGDCARQFRKRFNQDRGILEARAVTAVPLTEELKARLREKLERITGKQVDLRTAVDPAVLGGVRLEMDGKQLDGTLRTRLDGLRKSLREAVL